MNQETVSLCSKNAIALSFVWCIVCLCKHDFYCLHKSEISASFIIVTIAASRKNVNQFSISLVRAVVIGNGHILIDVPQCYTCYADSDTMLLVAILSAVLSLVLLVLIVILAIYIVRTYRTNHESLDSDSTINYRYFDQCIFLGDIIKSRCFYLDTRCDISVT